MTSLSHYYHVFGDSHLHEKLLGLTYIISADAFFQVNTLATERLYTLICDWCDVNEDSIVLGITNAEFICGKAEFCHGRADETIRPQPQPGRRC
ncbi:tRNA (uracil-5-)-methyltransferase homolog A-like [Sycon ciliatum]|uniref:tRNA (uracil-5-)-methyltransferase homolog A-like n=1 Tax=Sycon ciliatum TaxID=27933 RepID=UPI0031F64054